MYFQGEPSSCTSAGKAGTARMLYKKHELPKTVLWKGLANPDANPVATSTSSSAETHQGNCFHLWEMHKPLAVTFCGWPTAAKKVLFVKRTWNGPSLLKGDTFRHLKKEGESLDLLSPFLLLETLLVVSFAAVLELKLYLGRSPSTQGPPPGLAPQCTFRQPRGLLGPSASTVGHIFPDSHYNQPRWCRNIFPMLLDPGTQTPPREGSHVESLFHCPKPSCSPTVAPLRCQVSTWAMKISGLTSFPGMPIKAQAAIHPKYQFYSAVCVYNLFTSIPTSVCAC